MTKRSSTIKDQIKTALDGRTIRWLSFKVMIPENEISMKMSGKKKFTEEELDRINAILNSKIKLKILA